MSRMELMKLVYEYGTTHTIGGLSYGVKIGIDE